MTRARADRPAERPGADPRDTLTDHIPALRAFAMGLSRNRAEADDLVQDTLVKAWSNIEKYAPGTNMRAWLFTILRNTFFSLKRKRSREVADPDGIHAMTLFDRPAHDSRLAFGEFRVAFDKLSPEHREVLLLVGAEGFSCEEAAAMMRVAVGTVKSRANRARARLAEHLNLKPGETLLPDEAGTTLAVMGRSGIAAA